MSYYVDVVCFVGIVAISVVGTVVHACIQSQQLTGACHRSWCSFVHCDAVLMETSESMSVNGHRRNNSFPYFSSQCIASFSQEHRNWRLGLDGEEIKIDALPGDVASIPKGSGERIPIALPADGQAPTSESASMDEEDHSMAITDSSATVLFHEDTRCPVGTVAIDWLGGDGRWNGDNWDNWDNGDSGSDEIPNTCALSSNAQLDRCVRITMDDGRPVDIIKEVPVPEVAPSTLITDRACGRWKTSIQEINSATDGGGAGATTHAYSSLMYTFNGELDTRLEYYLNRLCDETQTRSGWTMARTMFGRMRQSCDEYVHVSVAQATHMQHLALEDLIASLPFGVNAVEQTALLFARSIGTLTLHGCGAFVDVQVSTTMTGALQTFLRDGEFPSGEQLRAAGVMESTVDEFASIRTKLTDSTVTADDLYDCIGRVPQYFEEVNVGLLRRPVQPMTDEDAAIYLQLMRTFVSTLCHTFKDTSDDGVFNPTFSVSTAHSILRGSAQACVHRYSEYAGADWGRVAPVTAPFRYTLPENHRFHAPTSTDWKLATQLGMKPLMVRVITKPVTSTADGVAASGAPDRCFEATKLLAPDLMERALFDSMISDRLLVRLQQLVERLRLAVIRTFTETWVYLNKSPTPSFKLVDLLRHQNNPSEVAHKVQTARVYLKQSAYGSMHGDGDDFLSTLPFSTTKGFVHAIISHAFERNKQLVDASVSSEANVCEFPSIFNPLMANAYYLSGSAANCVVIMLGLLQPPFVSVLFDEDQLLAMFGFYVAHELGHVAINFGFDQTDAWTQSFFQAYGKETMWHEVYADTVALLSILNEYDLTSLEGRKACERIWDSFAQTFCSSENIPIEQMSTHPMGNMRVDVLRTLFETHFPPRYTCIQ